MMMAPQYLSDYVQRVANSNRRRLRSSSSWQLVIGRTRLWSCVSDGWKPPLEQSAARRHLSSNAECFRNRLKLLFPIISFLTVFGLVLYSVYSIGLAVLYLSHSK